MVAAVFVLAPLGASAFSISPGTADIRVQPGETEKAEITAINGSSETETYYVRAVPFGTREDQMGPLFGIPDTAGVASWVQVPRTVVVPANGRTAIPADVRVPVGTKPGGYYAAVLVSASPADTVATAGVSSVQANIAALLFITVGGSGLEKLALLDVKSEGSALRDGLWGTFSYRLQNQGDVHVIPMGTVRVRDLFGREIASGLANGGGLRLMPQNTRTFSGVLPGVKPDGFVQAVQGQLKQFALGPVTVELSLSPGLTPETSISTSFRLWVVPWQLLVSALGGVAALYGLLKWVLRPKGSRT